MWNRLTVIGLCLALHSPGWGAWTSVASFASDANKTDADPYVVATSAQLDSGNVGICAVAIDNDGDGTDTNDFNGVTDAAGNTWVVIGENEADPAGASAGAAILIAYTLATSNLTSGANINFDLAATQTAKAATCWEFTVSGGATISQAGTEQKEDVSATQPGPLTIGSLSSAEHLWFRAVASEYNSDDFTAYSSGFTNLTANCTTGAGPTSNMCVHAEFIIATATTQTSDPAANISLDRASSMIALDESAGGGGGSTPFVRRRIVTASDGD